jgi:hypothetical protein
VVQGVGECWYIVHIQSSSVFSCPALLSVMWRSHYGTAGIHLTENICPLHVIDISVDTVFLLEQWLRCAHGQHPSCDK